jgi:hypothetical protein
MLLRKVVHGASITEFSEETKLIASGLYGTEVQQNPSDANITPRLTKTEIHHESLPHLSIAVS